VLPVVANIVRESSSPAIFLNFKLTHYPETDSPPEPLGKQQKAFSYKASRSLRREAFLFQPLKIFHKLLR
jgi:hypothetical protein